MAAPDLRFLWKSRSPLGAGAGTPPRGDFAPLGCGCWGPGAGAGAGTSAPACHCPLPPAVIPGGGPTGQRHSCLGRSGIVLRDHEGWKAVATGFFQVDSGRACGSHRWQRQASRSRENASWQGIWMSNDCHRVTMHVASQHAAGNHWQPPLYQNSSRQCGVTSKGFMCPEATATWTECSPP